MVSHGFKVVQDFVHPQYQRINSCPTLERRMNESSPAQQRQELIKSGFVGNSAPKTKLKLRELPLAQLAFVISLSKLLLPSCPLTWNLIGSGPGRPSGGS